MPEPSVRDLRRQQIVAEARRIVAEEGLGALTFGTLERRLAFTRGVITYHFRNKDEIVVAALKSAIHEIDDATRARVRRAGSPTDRLEATLRAQVEGFLAHREAARVLVAYWGQIPSEPGITELNARMYQGWRAFTARVAAEALGEADAAPAVAALVVGLVLGVVAQELFEPGAIDIEAVLDHAGRALRSLSEPSTVA